MSIAGFFLLSLQGRMLDSDRCWAFPQHYDIPRLFASLAFLLSSRSGTSRRGFSMPVLHPGMRKPPPGFEVVQEKLDAYEEAMQEAVHAESTGVVGVTTRRRSKATQSAGKRPRDEAEMVAGGSPSVDVEGADARPLNTAEVDSNETASVPPLWRVAQINRERTRYVFNAYWVTRSISKEVLDYCCDMQFIDAGLVRRWRLPGYEHLCCTACGVPGAAGIAAHVASTFAHRNRQERKDKRAPTAPNATCVCRVPAAQRKSKSFLACTVCGCKGCCSADVSRVKSVAATSASVPAEDVDTDSV